MSSELLKTLAESGEADRREERGEYGRAFIPSSHAVSAYLKEKWGFMQPGAVFDHPGLHACMA